MNYILLLCSLVFDTLKNAYTNHLGKNLQETQADTYIFNAGISGGAMLFCLLFAFFVPFSISSFSFVMAVFYAITTACAQYFMVMSMARGPMSYSILFTYLGGIIIPTAYATILAGQAVTVFQVIGLFCILLVGVATGAINLINVYLSGAMPGVIFFPIVNGGVILLSEITAIFGFKEKISRKQFVSIIAGIVAVCLLSL